ncbi:hypothetical protein DPMN_071641 [Dreissena polymorpha]|uniref:Uncharacterized protein n=1 Tax=Dreissena polymorpha TaxID=45954 RepID=A0A9D4BVX7_DREPO|nr:hypothetical protein DPMN_071641 [Dreissena polymorpha]
MWNIEETDLMIKHNIGKVVCLKGQTVNSVTSARGKHVTIVAGGSAAGVRLHPFYIFPGQCSRDDLLDGSFYALLF